MSMSLLPKVVKKKLRKQKLSLSVVFTFNFSKFFLLYLSKMTRSRGICILQCNNSTIKILIFFSEGKFPPLLNRTWQKWMAMILVNPNTITKILSHFKMEIAPIQYESHNIKMGDNNASVKTSNSRERT